MKPLIFSLLFLAFCFAVGGASARQSAWQPSPGHTQVPIWPAPPPDAQPVAGPELAKTTGKEFLVAGKPAMGVSNVSQPTMTVYSPNGKNTGAAIVAFPGGGYLDLAIDLEGTEVCDWLTTKGITCVLLKYRVPGNEGYSKSAPYPKSGLSGITNRLGRCPEDDRAGAFARGGLAHRSAQDWCAWVFVRRASLGSDQYAL